MNPETQAFATFARALADASAAVILPYFRSGTAVDDKADGSPVTIADRKAEEVMREMIMRELPTHGIIGEEFGTYQPDAEYQWVLDPIDGTKIFITGSFFFGTLIGLLHQGQPILGVINHPVTGHFLIGDNHSAQLNGEPVRVRPCQRIEDATMLASGHYYVGEHQNMAAYEALTRRAKLYRTWGDCHGYFLLATGYADAVFDPIMNPWDVLPVIPIVRGAGGVVTDWQGGDGVTSTVATAGGIHAAVIAALNPRS